MENIKEEIGEFLRANLGPRRIIALGAGTACVAICIAVLLGKMQLSIWQTALVLVVGLLFFEWAG